MTNPPTTAAELLDALVRGGVAEETSPRPGSHRTVRLRRQSVLIAHARLEEPGQLQGLDRATSTAARKLECFWNDQVANTDLRLLAVADPPVPASPDRTSSGRGALLVFGPVRGNPVRSVPASILARRLNESDRRGPGLPGLRWLAGALARFDRSEVPGMLVDGLLTTHTLTRRFRNSPKWRNAEKAVKAVPPEADWDETLRALGFSLALLSEGWLVRDGNVRVAVVLPNASDQDFARLDKDGRPPAGQLAALCAEQDVPFGFLASGGRLRLFDAGSPAAASEWLELDTRALLPADRPFLALFGPASLGGGFAELRQEARDYGARLWKRLDQRIRDAALPALARGLDDWAKQTGLDTKDEDERRRLEHASLTLLFRLMFLLYAESAGFLPMGNPVYRGVSLTDLTREARDTRDRLGPRSTALWSRFRTLVEAMRVGNRAWGVPAFNGALFGAAALDGAALLENLHLADPEFGDVLVALGFDDEKGRGVDYSSLEIGHLGHIYEALLSLSLSLTDQPVQYDRKEDTYQPAPPDEDPAAFIPAGALLWQTQKGGRKAGGVYYTPAELVRHLVERTVRPAYRAHLAEVEKTAAKDPDRAAKDLLAFAVVDPACGSGHFLVQVVDALADEAARFLARCPLPRLRRELEALREGGAGGQIEDMALLRRLLVKHSVFGVDVSPMGAEIATVSLWLASFVPGLALSYLGRNIRTGNSLIGVADRHAVVKRNTFEAKRLEARLAEAAKAAARVAASQDRTPDEYERSQAEDQTARGITAGLASVFDLWTAEPFGQPGNRDRITGEGFRLLTGNGDLPEALETRVRRAAELAGKHSFLHWALAFPRVFSRERPGFDVVVGNPPWEEVTVEELGFFALFRPGLQSLHGPERADAVAHLRANRTDLPDRLAAEQERAARERAALAGGEYESTTGDPDLYKYFCQRYRRLLRPGGRLGVVLPRSAFNAQGSTGFREWLHGSTTVERVDFLLNKGRWAFDAEPRYSIALLVAENSRPAPDHRAEVAGTADSRAAWEDQSSEPGLRIADAALGSDRQFPLLRSQKEADLLTKLRKGSPFPLGPGGRWKCFAVAELHETNDKKLWRSGKGTWQLWKGASFDQYDPHGDYARRCPLTGACQKKIYKPRPGSGQLAGDVSVAKRQDTVFKELQRARVAFRDVTNRTNTRTVIACLVPPKVLLTNKAPYLAFVDGDVRVQAAALAILNSLSFDWQARRFVEINLNFFILNGLIAPDLGEEDYAAIADAGARLSAVDDRFRDFAAAADIPCEELSPAERTRLRVEVDARMARAWELTESDLDVLLRDFTTRAVSPRYREALLDRFQELS